MCGMLVDLWLAGIGVGGSMQRHVWWWWWWWGVSVVEERQ
jgi:hypothetical protein